MGGWFMVRDGARLLKSAMACIPMPDSGASESYVTTDRVLQTGDMVRAREATPRHRVQIALSLRPRARRIDAMKSITIFRV